MAVFAPVLYNGMYGDYFTSDKHQVAGKARFMVYKFDEINVLVADSEPAIGELIRQVLYDFGARCHVEVDGNSALRYFERTNPDLIIVDWDLAGLNGVEFTKSIRSNQKNPYVPIIFMTALSSKKRVTAARDSGITEFARKPFSAISLYERIERIVEKPRPFVRSTDFFGPDRRVRSKEIFKEKDRRAFTPRLEKIPDVKRTIKKVSSHDRPARARRSS